MLNAREALKITVKANYEKEKERVKNLLTSSAIDFGYSLYLPKNKYLFKVLNDLGCIYNEETSIIVLTQYRKGSFMEALVLDVEKRKDELLNAVEVEIREAAENCHRNTIFSSVANKYQTRWVMNKLLANNFDASMNQEGDLIISW